MTPSAKSILAHLNATPSGATRIELEVALKIGQSTVGNVIGKLVAQKAIASVAVGGAGKDMRTRRYYAPHHAQKVEPRRAKQRTAPQKTPFDGEPRITSETKVTICPPFVDRRFEFNPPPGWKGEVTREWEKERSL